MFSSRCKSGLVRQSTFPVCRGKVVTRCKATIEKLKQLESLAKEAPGLRTRVAQLDDEVEKLREEQEVQQQKFPEIRSGFPDKAELVANLGFQQAALRIDAAEMMAKDQVLSLAKPEPACVPSTPKRMPKPGDDSRSPDSLASTCLPEESLKRELAEACALEDKLKHAEEEHLKSTSEVSRLSALLEETRKLYRDLEESSKTQACALEDKLKQAEEEHLKSTSEVSRLSALLEETRELYRDLEDRSKTQAKVSDEKAAELQEVKAAPKFFERSLTWCRGRAFAPPRHQVRRPPIKRSSSPCIRRWMFDADASKDHGQIAADAEEIEYPYTKENIEEISARAEKTILEDYEKAMAKMAKKEPSDSKNLLKAPEDEFSEVVWQIVAEVKRLGMVHILHEVLGDLRSM